MSGMNLEVIIPCLAEATACVKTKEVGEKPCCGDIDNPKIISPWSKYVANFEYTLDGPLFDLIDADGSENVHLEILLENMGGKPDLNRSQAISVPFTGAGNYTGQITFGPGNLTPGDVYKTIAKLTFTVGAKNVLVVCAFQELSSFHVSEAYAAS